MTDQNHQPLDQKPESNADNPQLEKIRITLEEISRQLKQQNRLKYHRDFSFSKMIGAIAQLLVIGVLFWTLIGLAELRELPGSAATMLKLLGASLLQLVALTFFVLDRNDR